MAAVLAFYRKGLVERIGGDYHDYEWISREVQYEIPFASAYIQFPGYPYGEFQEDCQVGRVEQRFQHPVWLPEYS